MILQGWVKRIWINESSVYGTLCIFLLKTLKMGLYFSEIDTMGWPYRRRDHTLPSNHSFTRICIYLISLLIFEGVMLKPHYTVIHSESAIFKMPKCVVFLFHKHITSIGIWN